MEQFGVSRESQTKLEIYVRLLLEWQERINLVGASTLAEVWTRHVIDSLQLLSLMTTTNRSVSDLGSGAGLPGLVLCIGGQLPAHLYESNGKKAAFLLEAIRHTGANAQVHRLRVEELEQTGQFPATSYVTARALAPLPRLLDWTAPFLARGATGLFHKGQNVEAELTEVAKYRKFNVLRHPSLIDPQSVILEIRDLSDDS
jgi:16S rRNA (guanine527-N7)-methyltransferase